MLEKYVTIRSGIDLDRFRQPERPREVVRDELGIPRDAPVVGTVTRLSAQRAPLDFVAAAETVAEQRPDAHFVIVGDGPLRAEVEEEVAAQGLTERIHLAGLRRDVPDLMHSPSTTNLRFALRTSFDVFALSSLWEGLPQAMAAGLPIVATAVDGNAEAVTDGVNGILTPPGDPQALAAALLKLLADPALAARMGQAGLDRVDEFGARKMVRDIAALYENLLAGETGRLATRQF